jgi:hypothetical protein
VEIQALPPGYCSSHWGKKLARVSELCQQHMRQLTASQLVMAVFGFAQLQVHPGSAFLAAHQQAAARKAGAMSLAERQLVSRAYARLQQLGEAQLQQQQQQQQQQQEEGAGGNKMQAGANSSWGSRPAATNWRGRTAAAEV